MKFITSLPLLSLVLPHARAAPNTRYSTVTVIPVPLSTTLTHYYPTGSSYPSISNKPNINNGYYNASANLSLSYTLSYPTTNLLPSPLVFAKRPAQPSISSKPLQCTPSELDCNNKTSFSLCVPAAEGGSRYIFMGAVAKGTTCDHGRIEKVEGGECTPVGNLKCQGERGFFLCDEGVLVF